MPEILLSSSTLSRKSSLSIRPVNPVKPYLYIANEQNKTLITTNEKNNKDVQTTA